MTQSDSSSRLSSPRSLRLCGESAAAERLSIRWANQRLDLYADRAVHWPKHKTLIIADPHFGKAAAFRAHGVPVPAGTTQCMLNRLTQLLVLTAAKRLIVLGDLLHAAAGRSQEMTSLVEQWRARHVALEIILVRGNHDHHAGDPPTNWNIRCVSEPFIEEPIAFCHHPQAACREADGTRRVGMAGHIHPCAVLRDSDGSSLRVACFHLTAQIAVLPAFGEFTGMHPVKPRRGDRVFAVAPGVVHEVRGRPRR